MMRIVNAATLTSHGNVEGRKAVVEILEAGLQAADPYSNARKMLRIADGQLIVGHPDFEPAGSPHAGPEVYDLSQIGRILVFGAGKGAQRVAKAIEDVLGDRLAGGHIIAKKGDDVILERIGVTLGGHPIPDEDCVRGCQQILALARDLKEEDLVFTIAANGVSSLLTLPVPGVSLEDVRRTTYQLQIERGVPTADLNTVRNHLDLMKGGRFSAYLQPARAIHLVVYYAESYEALMYHNVWLHNLPECTTCKDAIRVLKKWDAWGTVPASVRAHLERADPRYETIKADAFAGMSFRVFTIMPPQHGMVPAAQKRAAELGFRPHWLAERLQVEASQAGLMMAFIAATVEAHGQPVEPPCALFTSGELLVTVGQATGIGGRNQEFALASALHIAGSDNIVIGAVDSDGTDGPGRQFWKGNEDVPQLAGGIVDGHTAAQAQELGVDILAELRRHNASPALWKLKSGVVATRNVSMNDLGVALIQACN